MRVVVVWALSIVVSARLTRRLFSWENVDVSYSTFFLSFENQTQVYNFG